MDEILEFCQRVLGVGEPAADAAREAHASAATDRVALLAAASSACRAYPEPIAETAPALTDAGSNGLAAAVARELASATAKLPERQREALALRERAALSYDEISRVMGVGIPAVAMLLARARLRLREERRGAPPLVGPSCEDRDRALRALAQRQDGERLGDGEDGWLTDHLGVCEGCSQAHAAMLESSVCYRAWTLPAAPDGHGVDGPVGPEPAVAPDPHAPAPAAPTAGPDGAPDAERPPWWSRFREALAADARK